MKIGIAGPASLKMLASHVRHGERLPSGYLFAPMSTWVEELIERGHEISLFTLAPNINSPQRFAGDKLTIHIGRIRERGRAWDFFKQERHDLLQAIRQTPVDVLHAHWTYEFALAALDSGIPTLVTAHDAPLKILKFSRNAYRSIRALMAWQVCHRAPVMTAVSPYIQRHFEQFFGCKQSMQVIPNGISSFVFDLRRSTKQNSGRRNIVIASNLMGWAGLKNGQVLIEAFARLRRRFPECELRMFGDGHGPGQAAQQWAHQKGWTDGIQFRGQTPYNQLLDELSKDVDLLVHPALEESFSMAIAEAMALGIPVIGGKSSGAVPDTLQGGGLLVDVRSADEVMKAMQRLVENPLLRISLGHSGSKIARKHYSLSDVTDQYVNLYHQLTVG